MIRALLTALALIMPAAGLAVPQSATMPWNGRPAERGERLFRATMIAAHNGARRYFRPGRYPAVSRSGDWSDVGHHTQIVWPTSQRVGCAIASNRANDYLVCRYLPAGNVVGTILR